MAKVVSLMISTPGRLTKQAETRKERNPHRGKIVELTIRRQSMGLSEISRKVGVSRGTLYNWFEKEDLETSNMMKAGLAKNHNFLKEFPSEINEKSLSGLKIQGTKAFYTDKEQEAVYYWMEKYIRLLERYNETLNCKMD
ncbi:transcriptional regulator with XRE-family HTH domain [Mucilaginibacter sp. SG538B]|uniref:helix-turn-helix domain-containing protein n=1 Tax=Mucilaginibacter sp. SG538B TaxID=2587021 RepID=UPI00159D408C|nr:helix-turn-helix domain-containing protein [Mucilaginibacter sp. SG538B]NVM66547.1 transcriptional regulator with XRE-family HTH domain [Mucilaginibacter sp. SG538B]